MQKIMLPKPIFCPFAPAINSKVKEADAHNLSFLAHYKLLSTEELADYHTQGFAYMVSRMFPEAAFNDLCAVTDLNALLFIIDDQLEKQTLETVKDQKTAKAYIQAIIDVFLKRKSKLLYNPTLNALNDVWNRLCANSSEDWQSMFATEVEKVFQAGVLEMDLKVSGRVPTSAEYYKYRQYLGAANIATSTIPLTSNIKLDYSYYNYTDILKLTSFARNMVCFANDVFSLGKELKDSTSNLVLILMNEESLSMNESIGKVIDITNWLMQDFINLSSGLQGIPAAQKKEVDRYIRGLTHFVKGNIDWSENETTRYDFGYLQS